MHILNFFGVKTKKQKKIDEMIELIREAQNKLCFVPMEDEQFKEITILLTEAHIGLLFANI